MYPLLILILTSLKCSVTCCVACVMFLPSRSDVEAPGLTSFLNLPHLFCSISFSMLQQCPASLSACTSFEWPFAELFSADLQVFLRTSVASALDSREWSGLPGAQPAVPETFLRTSFWVQNSVDPLAETVVWMRAEHTLSVLEGASSLKLSHLAFCMVGEGRVGVGSHPSPL